jgi:hypothetical protein
LRNSSIHITLSILLTIAIADFTWQGFLEDQICISIDADLEKEEKLREGKENEAKFKYPSFDSAILPQTSFSDQGIKGLFSNNLLANLETRKSTKLYLLFRQMKLHC